MKNLFLSIMLLFATNIASLQAEEKPVILHPSNIGHGANQGGKHKTPIGIPGAFIDGHTLSFDNSCIGCPITLIDEYEIIVYTAVVDENGIVTLPYNLSGTYELQLERGSIIFVGEIEL